MRTKLVLLLIILILLSSCIPGDGKHTKAKPAGFLWGIWHGWIAPLSLIIGIFDGDIRIFESNNTGWWYGLGFYMAILGGFGGLSLSRRKRKKK